MRKDEICELVCQTLKSEGKISDYRYDHFRQEEAVPPPFALYRRVAPDNFSADGMVYHHGQNVDLELYAETPDEMATLMARAEVLLDAEKVYYKLAADTVYIESEDMYESLYEL